jgi:hypothetical protein
MIGEKHVRRTWSGRVWRDRGIHHRRIEPAATQAAGMSSRSKFAWLATFDGEDIPKLI